jgi:putative phage-type endonuclease
MRIINLMQSIPEWDVWRSEHLGASETPIIMGESPYSTPIKLWKQKMGIEPSNYVSPAMMHGAKTESEARRRFEEIQGKSFPSLCAESSNLPYISASFDGVSCDGEIVEIKCPHSKDRFFDMKMSNKVPPEYYGQLQHQMYVAEADFVYLFIYFPTGDCEGDYILHVVKRDEEYIARMLEKLEKFWKCIEEGEMPEYSAGDYQEKVSPEWQIKALALQQVMEEKRKLEEEEKQLKKALITLSHGKPTKAHGVTIFLQTRKGTLDTISIEKVLIEEGIDIELYRKKPSSSWCVKVS